MKLTYVNWTTDDVPLYLAAPSCLLMHFTPQVSTQGPACYKLTIFVSRILFNLSGDGRKHH